MDKCYNCGIDLNNEIQTREHIPAQNTFGGYPAEYKENRLVVPCCKNCNNDYSKIDQEIRDAIGIMNDANDEQNEITRKAIKSIMRRKNWIDRLYFDNGDVKAVSFDYNEFKELHIKNFKGVFYSKYGYPLPNEYEIEIIAEGDEEDQKLMGIAKSLYEYVDLGSNWQVSGHEDIFQFKLKAMIPTDGGQVVDGDDLENALGIVGVLIYHKTLIPIVFAAKKEYLQKVTKGI